MKQRPSQMSHLSNQRDPAPDELAPKVLQAALDAIVSVNAQGRIVGFNPAAERLFGRSREQVLGEDMATLLVPSKYRDRHLTAFRAHLEKGRTRILERRVEFEALHADGSLVPVELCVTRQEVTRDVLFTAFIRDLSEQKRMQTALRESETRYRLVAEHTGQLIYDYLTRTGNIEWTGAIEAVTGYPVQRFRHFTVGDWQDHIHPRDRADVMARLERAQAECGHFEADYRFRCRDGRYVEIHDSGVFLPGESGTAERMLGTMRDMSEVREYERRMRRAATLDELTGLPNRGSFLDVAGDMLEKARLEQGGMAMLVIDLDGFRNINDSLGPEAGDRLLFAAARRLQQLCPPTAQLGRLGSDEFGILLPSTRERAPAFRLAHEVQGALAREFQLENLNISASACLGMSFYPRDGEDASTLMLHADTALYRAKATGRGTMMLYSPHMERQTLESVVLASSLRRAIERNELSLNYQPIVDMQDGSILGLEALARWYHPEHGAVSPGRFIAVAEETGLIGEIGAWALNAACAQGRAWLDRGLPAIRLAVNVSARQLTDSRFVERVEIALRESGYPASQLTLELTESLTQSEERTSQILQSLREMGVRIAVDDFGTGYSSLSYLATLPIDFLKIDRAFVGKLPADSGQAGITRAIIAMARSLDLGIVAEGVETREQRDFLLQQNCRQGQGYFYSRPQSTQETTLMLQAGSLVPEG